MRGRIGRHGYAPTSWDDAVDYELSRWPGVHAVRVGTRKHNRLVLHAKGRSRFVVYPSSPTGHPRALRNHISDIRHILAGYFGLTRMNPGAQREKRA